MLFGERTDYAIKVLERMEKSSCRQSGYTGKRWPEAMASVTPSRLHLGLSAELVIVHMVQFCRHADVSVRGLWRLALRFQKDVETKQCCQTPCVAWCI